MSVKTRKRPTNKAVRINITLPPTLLLASEVVIRKHGFSGLSDYVQARIRRDAGLELNAA